MIVEHEYIKKGDIMKRGFTFPLGRKDVFVETTYKNKTASLAKKILKALNLPDNPGTVKEVLYYLVPATCELKTLKNGRQYYEIAGENFCGKGHFVDEDLDIIIKLDR